MAPEGLQQGTGKFDWGGLTLFLVSLAAVVLCAVMVWPFLPAITGAIVLAVVTRRPFRWLAARLRRPTLAAALAVVLVMLSIVTPALFVAHGLGRRVLDTARALQNGSAEQKFSEFLDEHPRIAEVVQYGNEEAAPGETLAKSVRAAAGKLAAFLGRSIYAVVQIVTMLFVLFFLYRDEREATKLVRTLLPLDRGETEYLMARLRTALRALVLGRFAVAALQGVVAGITFACLRVHAATLLGMATMFFALVPAVGAYVVWLPVAIYLAALHFWIRAAILVVVGSLVISTLDNFLYPVLVGSRLRLHTVPIFLAMMGGVWFFGVCGLVLGPMVFNLTASLFQIWRCRARGEPLSRDAAAG